MHLYLHFVDINKLPDKGSVLVKHSKLMHINTYHSSVFIRVFVVVLRILRGEINANSLTKLKMGNSSIEFLMAVVMCCSSNLWFSFVV